MALFDLTPQRATRDGDRRAVAKTQVKRQAPVTVKGGGLLDRINQIAAMVENNLGQYKDDYLIIRDVGALRRYVDVAISNGVISIDTETTGLDPMQDELVGICIYTPNEKAAYIPVGHVSYITGARIDGQLSKDVLKREFDRLVGIDVIMFNAQFDIRFLRNQLGVYLDCTWDAYLAARLMNENEEHKGLKSLHRKYVLNGEGDAFSFDELFRGITFDKIPIEVGYLYAAHDAIITYELYDYQKRFMYYDASEPNDARNGMNGVSWVFFNIEMPCVKVVCDMEDNGVKFDFEYQRKLSEKYNALLQEKTDEFYACCSEYVQLIERYKATHANHRLDDPINIASPTQIAVLLYDVLQVDPPDAKNPRGTGEGILRKIDLPIVKAILDYREMSKLVTTYIDKLPECVNPKDGRIHCHFNQYGADTGRFSSSDPNLQNIPSHNKDIRKMFVASDGYVLMSSDYSQQEPKVMTQMCGDPKMIKAYQEGKDLYAEIAALSFNTTYDNCLEFRPDGTTNPEGKKRRSEAKSILLG